MNDFLLCAIKLKMETLDICKSFAKFTKRAEMHIGSLQLQERSPNHKMMKSQSQSDGLEGVKLGGSKSALLLLSWVENQKPKYPNKQQVLATL